MSSTIHMYLQLHGILAGRPVSAYRQHDANAVPDIGHSLVATGTGDSEVVWKVVDVKHYLHNPAPLVVLHDEYGYGSEKTPAFFTDGIVERLRADGWDVS